MSNQDYWEESVEEAMSMVGVEFNSDQLKAIGASLAISHENYSLSHYTPPSSDRIDSVEREWKQKYQALEKQFEQYRYNAHEAVKNVGKMRSDTKICIKPFGEVEILL